MMEGEVDVFTDANEIDSKYEFSAPMYFDFSYEETQADVEEAERWFESAIPYEASRKSTFVTPDELVGIYLF